MQQNFAMMAFLAQLIELKVRHMEKNKELWEEFEMLVCKMNVCKSAAESETLMKEIASLLEKMEETELPLAFRTVQLMQAEQYSAEWVCNKNSKGEVLSAWCNTTRLKPEPGDWDDEDKPLKAKKRSYRTHPLERFMENIEIEIHGKFYYLKANMDFRNYALEWSRKLKPSTSLPSDLFGMLNKVVHQNHKTGILGPETQFDQRAPQIWPEVFLSGPRFTKSEMLLSTQLTHLSL